MKFISDERVREIARKVPLEQHSGMPDAYRIADALAPEVARAALEWAAKRLEALSIAAMHDNDRDQHRAAWYAANILREMAQEIEP